MTEAAERMSRVDTAWLRMDNDVNLMMIVGVWLVEPAISADAARAHPDPPPRLPALRPEGGARTRPARAGPTTAVRHRQPRARRAARASAGQSRREALQARAGELATTPLDPDRPLWQFHLIERYEGGSALIARIHHCIGDGIALISVMMSITDGGARRRPRAPATPTTSRSTTGSPTR